MQNIVITGANRGIGLQLAKIYAKAHRVYALCRQSSQELDALNNVTIISGVDLKDQESITVAVSKCPDRIDVLINNAGFGLFGSFIDTDWERESEMLHVHILTTTHLTKLVLEGMVKRGYGKILNMSSLAAFQPGPLMAIYYASKGYMLSFSEAIANELKGTGVTVTALCPGPTKTSFQKTVSSDSVDNKITFNMASAKAVAAYGYKAMLNGRTYAIPGKFNKFLAILPRIVSRNAAASIVRRIQEKNRH